MSKIQPVVTRWKNTIIRKERTYDVLSIQRESGNDTKNNRKKRHLRINKRKKERSTCVWLSGCLHIEGRLKKGPRLQQKHKYTGIPQGCRIHSMNFYQELDVFGAVPVREKKILTKLRPFFTGNRNDNKKQKTEISVAKFL